MPGERSQHLDIESAIQQLKPYGFVAINIKKSCGGRPKSDRKCIEVGLKSSSETRANFCHFVLKEYFHWDHHNYMLLWMWEYTLIE